MLQYKYKSAKKISTKFKKMESKKLFEDEELEDYLLTIEEMISVKGGDSGDPVYKPGPPPVQI